MPNTFLSYTRFIKMLEQLEQMQLRMDEAEEALIHARANLNAATSCVGITRIELWKIETYAAQACMAECAVANSNPSGGALQQDTHALEVELNEALRARDAAQARLDRTISLRDLIAAQLMQLQNLIEAERDTLLQAQAEQQGPAQPQQEVPADEHKHDERRHGERDEARAEQDRVDLEIEQLSNQLIETLTLMLSGQNASEVQLNSPGIDFLDSDGMI